MVPPVTPNLREEFGLELVPVDRFLKRDERLVHGDAAKRTAYRPDDCSTDPWHDTADDGTDACTPPPSLQRALRLPSPLPWRPS